MAKDSKLATFVGCYDSLINNGFHACWLFHNNIRKLEYDVRKVISQNSLLNKMINNPGHSRILGAKVGGGTFFYG